MKTTTMTQNNEFHFKYATVAEVGHGENTGKAKVNFPDDSLPSDWLPILVRKSKTDKESWPLELYEHVCCIMDERCENGVILGAIVSKIEPGDPDEAPGKFRKKFSDGTVIEYDKSAGKFTGDIKGEIIAKATGNVTIEAQGDIDAKAVGNASIEAAQVKATATVSAEVEAPSISLKGNVSVQGTLTVAGAISGASVATGGCSMASNSITVSGDLIAGGKSFINHIHGGVQPGGGFTSPLQ